MKIALFIFSLLPCLGFAQNPFNFVGQTRTAIEATIGKPVTRNAKDGNREQYAYPFSKSGDYHILYVSDIATAFVYKPKMAAPFSLADVPPTFGTLRPAEVQPNDVTLLVDASDKLTVELKGERVVKITMR